MLNQKQLQKYLGRSLSSLELAHLNTYLSLTKSHFERILCMNLDDESSTKSYDGRLGYKLLYIDPISDVSSVTVDGEPVESADYTLKQWDNRNATWYNVIEFKDAMTGDVEIVGTWGFPELPEDLALLFARLFNQNSVEQSAGARVKSKKVDDYSVTYADPMTSAQLADQNAAVISKYSLCRAGDVRHGEVGYGHLYTLS